MTLLLDFKIECSGYTSAMSYGVVETQLEGGATRKRQDVIGAPHYVTATWIIPSREDYNFFMYIFRQELKDATLPFLADVVTDSALTIRHICRTVGGMPKLSQQRGFAYWVTATLEVEPLPTVMGLVGDAGSNSITGFPFFGAQVWTGKFLVADQVTIFGLNFTHSTLGAISLDGTYTVATIGSNFVTLTNPGGVNAAWTTALLRQPLCTRSLHNERSQ
jgi:hypothetical protein